MSRPDVLVDATWVQAYLRDPAIVLIEVDGNATPMTRAHPECCLNSQSIKATLSGGHQLMRRNRRD